MKPYSFAARWATVVLLVLIVFAAAGAAADSTRSAQGISELVVHFIDVGQGDATLFQAPDATLLIDAGRHDHDDVVPYLRSVGVNSIDLLVGTHPHADHIGQFPQVLAAFSVGEVWLSGDAHTTRTFERAIDAILASEAGYHEPRAGEVYAFGEARPLEVEVLHPAEITGEFHEGSIALRITYGSLSFILTGDAEADEERQMIGRGANLRAQVLQLGHHGSRTSSSALFLDAVRPEVAVYSAGAGNTYGHPHHEVIRRLEEQGIRTYGTDVHGTIRIVTDGRTYRVLTERNGEAPMDETPPSTACAPGQVDINSASKEDLTKIIHIGPARAKQLIEHRPFASLDDLTRIKGIGPSRVRDIKEEGVACVG